MMRVHTAMRLGMTLVELMVAIVITGMALAAGYAALSTIIDRRAQTDTAITDVARAAAVRRTIIDWLEHGQLLFTRGIPRDLSNFGSNNADDELQFVTVAPTPLHSDSTSVRIYVGNYTDDTNGSVTVQGLLAVLTPTIGAMRGMQTDGGGSVGQGLSNTNPLSATASNASYGSMVIPLDSTVTGLAVEYLVDRADQQHWESSIASMTNWQLGRPFLRAVRLTLLSSNSPVLRLPIVVPMQMVSP